MTTKTLLLGVPIDLGAKNLGVSDGPDAFRRQDIIAKLEGAGLDITDGGNEHIPDRSQLKPGDQRMRYLDEIARVSESVSKKTGAAIHKGHKVVALGGDHSLNLGVVAGASVALGGDLGLIYLDAHGDMNTPETTLSGNVHGMHLASLLGWGPDELVNVHGKGAKIARNNLLHIGGCDFDQAEIELCQRESLNTFMMFDLLAHGMGPLFKMIDDLANRVSNIWVSLDLDAIDELYAPGAGMPNKRGLSYREVATIAEYIGRTKRVVGIDVVEYNPAQDVNNKTAELGIELIAKFLGHNYSWYTEYMSLNNVKNT
jgi:arginase